MQSCVEMLPEVDKLVLQEEVRAERQEARLHNRAVNAALHGNFGKALNLEARSNAAHHRLIQHAIARKLKFHFPVGTFENIMSLFTKVFIASIKISFLNELASLSAPGPLYLEATPTRNRFFSVML